MSDQVATLYGANRPSCAPDRPYEVPTSTTSGALDWPLVDLTALISSPLEPSGFSLLTLIPYLVWNVEMIVP